MPNYRVRVALMLHNMKNWELAKKMGVSEFTLSRKLREELPEEDQDELVRIIEEEGRSE